MDAPLRCIVYSASAWFKLKLLGRLSDVENKGNKAFLFQFHGPLGVLRGWTDGDP